MKFEVVRRNGRIWLDPSATGWPLMVAFALACELAGWGRL